jgi:hypothetical protein
VARLQQLLSPDVNELFANYNSETRSLLDKHAPFWPAQVNHRHSALWYDVDSRAAKFKLRRLEKQYRHHQSPESLAAWCQQSDQVRSLFQDKYKMYWTNQLVNCRGDSRAVWANVKHLLQLHSTSSTTLTVTDFDTHFGQKIANIRQSTANVSDPVIVPRATDALFIYLANAFDATLDSQSDAV